MAQIVAEIGNLRKTIASELKTFDLGPVQKDLVARAQGYVQSGNLEDQERERAFAEQLKQMEDQLRQKDEELAQLR